MRKILTAVLMALTMLLTACGGDSAQSQTQPSEQAAAEAPKTRTLVAYFSCTGTTKTLAENAAQVFEADLFEIKPKEPYTTEDLDWHNETSRSTVEMKDDSVRPEIDGKIENFAQYTTIVIAYPIWWHQAPRIIDTFVESYDWRGKKIIPICTSGGSDIGTSGGYLANLAKTGDWREGHCFMNDPSLEKVKAWADSLE